MRAKLDEPSVVRDDATINLVVPAGARRGTRARLFERRRSGSLWALPFIIPAALLLGFVVLVPSLQGGLYAFTNWNGLGSDWDFVGLHNFTRFFRDPLATSSITHTVLLTVVTTIAMNVLGLLLAVALNSRIRLKGFYRALFFAPVIVTPVIVSNLWKYLYLPDGPINELLRTVGLGELAEPWLGNSDTALGAVIVTIIWQHMGVAMVIYLAGLQGVPTEIVEAARMDGAGSVRIFFAIVLPQLRPAVVTSTLLFLIAGLKAFDQVWVLTQGGPGSSTQTLSTAQYQVTFLYGDYAYGATFAVVLSVLAISVAVIQQIVARRGRE